jgi:hypothetical protein
MANHWAKKELIEHEEIAREIAIQKIATLVQQFELKRADLFKIFEITGEELDSDSSNYVISNDTSERLFDPFFDAW